MLLDIIVFIVRVIWWLVFGYFFSYAVVVVVKEWVFPFTRSGKKERRILSIIGAFISVVTFLSNTYIK